MKYVILFLGVMSVGLFFVWNTMQPEISTEPPAYTGSDTIADDSTAKSDRQTPGDTRNPPRTEIIAENLSIPWELLFLPDGELLVTERAGNLVLLKQNVVIPVPGVRHVGEGGLLGAALHPDFAENNFVYLYQTTEEETGLINRISRYTLRGNELAFDQTIVDSLPGAQYHDGGRIAFGPDGYLYVTLGDAGDSAAAQDTQDLAGSILRYTADGNIPENNPFDNAIYTYGHRNPQGLTWDDEGNMWSSEHGRSGVRSGYDEINRIVSGRNYGWPDSQGDTVADGTTGPVRHSTANITWAPGGLAYVNGSLYMPGLRGETVYRAVLEGTKITAWHEYFVGEYGRLRTVVVGPDNLLYVTTSNRDGRGNPAENDDLIIRIHPELLDQS